MFEERVADLEALGRQQGLEFFPTFFEVIPQDMMTEIAAYGLELRDHIMTPTILSSDHSRHPESDPC
jgi:sugar phosphate isomerase/epimerase